MNQKIYYHNKLLAYLLIAPQILITLIFLFGLLLKLCTNHFWLRMLLGLGLNLSGLKILSSCLKMNIMLIHLEEQRFFRF